MTNPQHITVGQLYKIFKYAHGTYDIIDDRGAVHGISLENHQKWFTVMEPPDSYQVFDQLNETDDLGWATQT